MTLSAASSEVRRFAEGADWQAASGRGHEKQQVEVRAATWRRRRGMEECCALGWAAGG